MRRFLWQGGLPLIFLISFVMVSGLPVKNSKKSTKTMTEDNSSNYYNYQYFPYQYGMVQMSAKSDSGGGPSAKSDNYDDEWEESPQFSKRMGLAEADPNPVPKFRDEFPIGSKPVYESPSSSAFNIETGSISPIDGGIRLTPAPPKVIIPTQKPVVIRVYPPPTTTKPTTTTKKPEEDSNEDSEEDDTSDSAQDEDDYEDGPPQRRPPQNYNRQPPQRQQFGPDHENINFPQRGGGGGGGPPPQEDEPSYRPQARPPPRPVQGGDPNDVPPPDQYRPRPTPPPPPPEDEQDDEENDHYRRPPPRGHHQGGPPPQNDQYGPPPQNDQYGPPPQNDHYGQPPSRGRERPQQGQYPGYRQGQGQQGGHQGGGSAYLSSGNEWFGTSPDRRRLDPDVTDGSEKTSNQVKGYLLRNGEILIPVDAVSLFTKQNKPGKFRNSVVQPNIPDHSIFSIIPDYQHGEVMSKRRDLIDIIDIKVKDKMKPQTPVNVRPSKPQKIKPVKGRTGIKGNKKRINPFGNFFIDLLEGNRYNEPESNERQRFEDLYDDVKINATNPKTNSSKGEEEEDSSEEDEQDDPENLNLPPLEVQQAIAANSPLQDYNMRPLTVDTIRFHHEYQKLQQQAKQQENRHKGQNQGGVGEEVYQDAPNPHKYYPSQYTRRPRPPGDPGYNVHGQYDSSQDDHFDDDGESQEDSSEEDEKEGGEALVNNNSKYSNTPNKVFQQQLKEDSSEEIDGDEEDEEDEVEEKVRPPLAFVPAKLPTNEDDEYDALAQLGVLKPKKSGGRRKGGFRIMENVGPSFRTHQHGHGHGHAHGHAHGHHQSNRRQPVVYAVYNAQLPVSSPHYYSDPHYYGGPYAPPLRRRPIPSLVSGFPGRRVRLHPKSPLAQYFQSMYPNFPFRLRKPPVQHEYYPSVQNYLYFKRVTNYNENDLDAYYSNPNFIGFIKNSNSQTQSRPAHGHHGHSHAHGHNHGHHNHHNHHNHHAHHGNNQNTQSSGEADRGHYHGVTGNVNFNIGATNQRPGEQSGGGGGGGGHHGHNHHNHHTHHNHHAHGHHNKNRNRQPARPVYYFIPNYNYPSYYSPSYIYDAFHSHAPNYEPQMSRPAGHHGHAHHGHAHGHGHNHHAHHAHGHGHHSHGQRPNAIYMKNEDNEDFFVPFSSANKNPSKISSEQEGIPNSNEIPSGQYDYHSDDYPMIPSSGESFQHDTPESSESGQSENQNQRNEKTNTNEGKTKERGGKFENNLNNSKSMRRVKGVTNKMQQRNENIKDESGSSESFQQIWSFNSN